MTIVCVTCKAKFKQRKRNQKFCSDRCRRIVHRREVRAKARAMRANLPKPKRARRGLLCHWCRGPHRSGSCPNRNGASVKLYGTLGPNREYVPPPGVKVRFLVIPKTVHSNELRELLKEAK